MVLFNSPSLYCHFNSISDWLITIDICILVTDENQFSRYLFRFILNGSVMVSKIDSSFVFDQLAGSSRVVKYIMNCTRPIKIIMATLMYLFGSLLGIPTQLSIYPR